MTVTTERENGAKRTRKRDTIELYLMAVNMSGDGEFISLAGRSPAAAAAAAAAAAVTGCMAVTGRPARDSPPKWAGNVLALPTLSIMKCLSPSVLGVFSQNKRERDGGEKKETVAGVSITWW